MRRAEERIAAAAVVATVVVVALSLVGLLGRGEPLGDDLSIHLAEIDRIARALRAGDANLWNPSANLGFPSGYYYQVLPQLVPAAAAAIGHASPGALVALFKLFAAIPLLLAPIATWRALRFAGVGAAESAAGAALPSLVAGPIGWGLGGDSLWATGLYTQAWALVFAPLAFAALARWILDGRALGRTVAWTLLTGLCHPFFAVCLAPAALVLPWWRGSRARAAGRAAIVLGLVLAGSAFFWLPILVHRTAFGGFPARRAVEHGIGAVSLVGILVRGRLLGWITLLLVPAGVAAARGHGATRGLFALGAMFLLLVALGPIVGPVGGDLIPWIRFLAPAQLALAAAAGVGTVALARELAARTAELPTPRRTRLYAAGILVAAIPVSLGAVALLAPASDRPHARTAFEVPAAHREDLGTLLAALAPLPPGRVAAGARWGTGSHLAMYLPSVLADKPALVAHGGAALQSSPLYAWLRGFSASRHARLYGVRYALCAPTTCLDWPGARVVARTETAWLVAMPDPGLLVPAEITGAATNPTDVSTWLASDDPRTDRFLTVGADDGLRVPPHGRTLAARESPSRVDAKVSAAEPTTFVLRVAWHPGWRAAIDGVAAPIRRVTPGLLAVDVPAGEHELVLTFHRPRWSWALLAASAALLALLALTRRLRYR